MKKSKKSKNTVKNRWDCVQIFMCACVGVIVAYYCKWMCKWALVYVYMKIHAQCDKLEVVYRIGERNCIETLLQ